MIQVYLAGVATQLQVGDGLLFVGDERIQSSDGTNEQWDFRFVQSIQPQPDQGRTAITLHRPLEINEAGPTQQGPRVYAMRQRASIFGYNAPAWSSLGPKMQKAQRDADQLEDQSPSESADPDSGGKDWPDFDQILDGNYIPLDAAYPKVLPSNTQQQSYSWAVLKGRLKSGASLVTLGQIKDVRTGSPAQFGITSKSTQFMVDNAKPINDFSRRDTTVYVQSEELTLASRKLDARQLTADS